MSTINIWNILYNNKNNKNKLYSFKLILGVLELEGKFKDLKWSNKMLLCY